MFPLPNFINVKLTLNLKLIASKIGVSMMQTYGMPVFREGNIIDLGFTQLQVVDACSGLRSFIAMILLSILIAYFYRVKFWKKAVIVISSIPLVILANAFRIALTGILSEKFGSIAVEGFFHDFEGVLIFMITLGVLMGEIWLFNKFFPEHQIMEPMENDRDEIPDSEKIIQGEVSLTQPRFVLSVVFLGLTLLLSRGIEFREAVPMSRSFNEFPMKVGQWQGKLQVMEKMFIDALDLTDYIMADFVDENGRGLNFYVAYYESQRKGESIHTPATCLRGGGWEFKEAGDAFVPFDRGGGIPVRRALIQKGPYKQISYYWYPMRGRLLTNVFQMKWYNFWDALTRQRTDGALVRVIAPVGENETISDTEERLQSFVRKMSPVLSEFLPK
jgi:exosortase D (VPLPA-CTERM-specific)